MAIPRQRSIGRYELLIELARGGMAELFLGRLHGAGGFAKLVAIKRILPHLVQDPQFTEMFKNEGRIAAQLAHPNVCQVFELDEVDGELFLAMEYLDGVAWEHLVGAPSIPAMRLAAGVLAQAADGLHYAHTLRDVEGRPTPVVHRDVSPQNLFVTVDGVCKVLDFGVSKMMKDGPRTRSGVIKGKLPYMAPEQIRGDFVDGRADVFSLGVCAWEAFAGVRLFDRETDFQIWKAITEEDVAPIATHWPACPPALDAAVRRALDRDPDRRQATARELADDLRGHAGMASLGEIADTVRTRCGDRIAARASLIAGALSERRAADDLGASATLVRDAGETVDEMAKVRAAEDTADMAMRRGSVRIQRPVARPSADDDTESADTRSGRRGDDGAGRRDDEMRSGRDESRSGRRDAGTRGGRRDDESRSGRRDDEVRSGRHDAGTRSGHHDETRSGRRDAGTRSSGRDDDASETGSRADRLAQPPRRGHLATAIVAASVAAVVTAIVVVIALRRGAAPAAPVAAPDAAAVAEAKTDTDSDSDTGSDTGTSTGIPALDQGMSQLADAERDLSTLRDRLAPVRDALVRTRDARREPARAAPAKAAADAEKRPVAAEPGYYSVDSKPYATIYADGTYLGETPLRAKLPAGKHAIRAVLADGREQTLSIVVPAGDDVTGKLAW